MIPELLTVLPLQLVPQGFETSEFLTISRELQGCALWTLWRDLHQFRSIDGALGHFGVTEDAWRAFELQVGSPGSDLRLLASLPKVALVARCGSPVFSQGALTPIQAAQVGLVWLLPRRTVGAHSNVTEEDFVDMT